MSASFIWGALVGADATLLAVLLVIVVGDAWDRWKAKRRAE